MGNIDELIARANQLTGGNINTSTHQYISPIHLAQQHWESFETPPHITLINQHLIKLNDGEIKKLGVFMPPRHGKSEIISKYFLAWYIICNPDKRIIFVTYGHEFAAEFGLEVRDIVNEMGGDIKIRQDMRQKNKFFIKDHRGQCTFTGIGGSITGKGADILIIDDPIKGSEQALSAGEREKMKHWYRTVANTRLEPGASQVIIQTRWHEDDLSGWLLEEQPGQWNILSLPAIATEDDDIIGRKKGEALWPTRFPIEELERLRTETGSYWFASMYQQNPQPEEGNIFNPNWIRRASLRIGDSFADNGVMAIDLAISEKKSADQTAICTVTMTYNGDIYVRGLRYGRWGNTGNKENFAQEYTAMQPDVTYCETNNFQRIFKEDIGKEYGIYLVGIQNSGSKDARIQNTLMPLFEAGRIIFDESIDLEDEFMNEYLSFPNGKHDDLLDALEMAVSKINLGGNPYTEADGKRSYYEGSIGYNKQRSRRPKVHNPYGVSHGRRR